MLVLDEKNKLGFEIRYVGITHLLLICWKHGAASKDVFLSNVVDFQERWLVEGGAAAKAWGLSNTLIQTHLEHWVRWYCALAIRAMLAQSELLLSAITALGSLKTWLLDKDIAVILVVPTEF